MNGSYLESNRFHGYLQTKKKAQNHLYERKFNSEEQHAAGNIASAYTSRSLARDIDHVMSRSDRPAGNTLIHFSDQTFEVIHYSCLSSGLGEIG
ncbi:hypothetical protein WN55_10660 [Dufourea novaeangliae]|uniref:Uncharacterized protein n=1 Tax=Dufourea novaeangliae TaxID=178035 RepID=A0A154P9E8_DUFNO|nr:hypothetical protein WN55_10660 [Dufourea novaeangliae]